jgi:hypothetical protein
MPGTSSTASQPFSVDTDRAVSMNAVTAGAASVGHTSDQGKYG